MATSTATFSFGAHSAYTPGYRTNSSRISVLGVPGYAEATRTPASNAPRATASFPERNCVFFLPAGVDTFSPAGSAKCKA